jgi:dTDP-4-dehydrorhamnose reductase
MRTSTWQPSFVARQSYKAIQRAQADLKSGEGLSEAFAKAGPIDAVINCAAMSSPAACEKDAATARWV